MPVFGGGTSRFQPVYAGDIARFVSMCVDNGSGKEIPAIQGKIFEAGGPDGERYCTRCLYMHLLTYGVHGDVRLLACVPGNRALCPAGDSPDL